MNKTKLNRWDKTIIGLVIGLILPIVIFLLLYFLGDQSMTLKDYLQSLWQINALLKILSLCFLINFLSFMFFIRKKWDMAARGVLGATILYTLFVLINQLI